MKDIQNEVDSFALMIRTKDEPVELMGYCPAFFAKDFNKLVELNGDKKVNIYVHKINEDAPLQLKLLCRLVTEWPDSFNPFDEKEFYPYSL